jgi:chromosome segregation ATPase
VETTHTKQTKPLTAPEQHTGLRDDTIARFAEIKARCDALTNEANALRGEIADLDARREQLAGRLKDLKKQAKSAELEIVAIAREIGHAVEKGDSPPAPLHIA